MIETLATATMCLALNVYHEARGEPQQGQVAVAHVTINRATKRNTNVCFEVTRPYQFSWLNDGGLHWDGRKWRVDQGKMPTDLKAWQKALEVAKAALVGISKDPTHGATFYHADYVQPGWTAGMYRTKAIGKHYFYHPTMMASASL